MVQPDLTDRRTLRPRVTSDRSGSEEGADRASSGMDDDPRVAFVYQEALRGLLQQQAAVESLHNRAGTLIFAASFASSLLGSNALANGVDVWDWVALALLLSIGVLAVLMLWPYYAFSFRFDPEELLRDYVEAERPASMTEMHRALAVRAEHERRINGPLVRRIRVALEVALVLLLLEIVAWLFSIGGIFD
jgi:hypothetical protein